MTSILAMKLQQSKCPQYLYKNKEDREKNIRTESRKYSQLLIKRTKETQPGKNVILNNVIQLPMNLSVQGLNKQTSKGLLN